MGNWFDGNGKKGKVSLEQQMTGLYRCEDFVYGSSVFDFGCAKGEIGEIMLAWGAALVDGIDNRADAVRHANSIGLNAIVADAERWMPLRNYDVCLMLGILHKLKDPAAAMRRVMGCCTQHCVIRLPGGQWPILVDSRSGSVPIDLGSSAKVAGFELFAEEAGPHGQWVGYFQRIGGTSVAE